MRRVRCTVSPKQEWKHCRLEENYTASPSSSGSWSTLRAFLSLFAFFVFCPLLFCFLFQTGLCKLHSRQRAPYKNQLTFPNECGHPRSFIARCDFLVVLSHPPFILLSVFCFFLIFAHWAAHTDHLLSHLSPFPFSLEGLTPCSHCV